jgi:hypothetical protein
VGTFEVVVEDGLGLPPAGRASGLLVVLADLPQSTFFATTRSGTLTITSSSESVVRGRLTFSADGSQYLPTGNEQGVVTVEGDFVAVRSDTEPGSAR